MVEFKELKLVERRNLGDNEWRYPLIPSDSTELFSVCLNHFLGKSFLTPYLINNYHDGDP